MGARQIRFRDDGTDCTPSSDDEWRSSVSAPKTSRYVPENPLLDWLDEYDIEAGYQLDAWKTVTSPTGGNVELAIAALEEHGFVGYHFTAATRTELVPHETSLWELQSKP